MISDKALATIPLIISAATPAMLAFMAWMQNRSAKKAEIGTEQVKQALASSDAATAHDLSEIKVTTNQTHVLVNSQKGVLLKNLAVATKATALLAREKSNRTNTSEDEMAASEFEALARVAIVELASHEGQQAKVDASK